MNILSDKRAHEKIRQLQDELRELRAEVRQLEKEQEYGYKIMLTPLTGYYRHMTGREVDDRFGQLYDHLGIQREQIKAHTVLCKKSK